MKNLHQNLLIFFAIALCGLCVWQWYGQTAEREHVDELTRIIFDKSTAIQTYTNSIATLNSQIAQLDAGLSGMKQFVKTNADTIRDQSRQIHDLDAANAALTKSVAQYRGAFEKTQDRLKEAYAGIEKQNLALKQLAEQRDEFVQKYNDSVKQRNEVVKQYNDLVAQVEKIQAAAAKNSGR